MVWAEAAAYYAPLTIVQLGSSVQVVRELVVMLLWLPVPVLVVVLS